MISLKVPGDLDHKKARDFIIESLVLTEEEADSLFERKKIKKNAIFGALSPDDEVEKGKKVFVTSKENYRARKDLVDVVYEDEDYLVLNKPQGMSCIGDSDNGENLYQFAVKYMTAHKDYDVDSLRVPYICNILPKEIGGLVIVAKEQYLFEELLMALRERRIKRNFRVIVTGEPKEKELLHGYMLGSSGNSKAQMRTESRRDTRPAALRYKLVDRKGDLSLLEVEPLSLYRNQIFLQLSQAGLPVLGDYVYGEKKINRSYCIDTPAIWQHRVIFQTGRSNFLDYLNGKEVEGETWKMPGIRFFEDEEVPIRLRRIEELNTKQLRQFAKLVWNSYSRSIAPWLGKEQIMNFRSRYKVGSLAKDMVDGKLRLFGCYTRNGLAGVMAIEGEDIVSLLFVKPSEQNRGIGALLLEHAYSIVGEGRELLVKAYGQSDGYFAKKEFAEKEPFFTAEEGPYTLMSKLLKEEKTEESEPEAVLEDTLSEAEKAMETVTQEENQEEDVLAEAEGTSEEDPEDNEEL